MVIISCEPGWTPVASFDSGSEDDTVVGPVLYPCQVDTGNLALYLGGRLALGRRGSDGSGPGRRGRTST